jgi:hypothetical protein
MLTANGIDSMHPTTIAKIEAGDREVKLDEAEALADLYGMSLDTMMGKGLPDESSLTFALMNASSYAALSSRRATEARHTATDLDEILEDMENRFGSSEVLELIRSGREAARHLDSAIDIFDLMDTTAAALIVAKGQQDGDFR